MRDMLIKEIEELSEVKKVKTADLMAQAIKIGLNKLWQEMVLGKYLSKKITRKEAVKLAGLNNVRLAERQKKAVLEDIRWGLQHAG